MRLSRQDVNDFEEAQGREESANDCSGRMNTLLYSRLWIMQYKLYCGATDDSLMTLAEVLNYESSC